MSKRENLREEDKLFKGKRWGGEMGERMEAAILELLVSWEVTNVHCVSLIVLWDINKT